MDKKKTKKTQIARAPIQDTMWGYERTGKDKIETSALMKNEITGLGACLL